MRNYVERLHVPVLWWLLAIPTALSLGGYFYEAGLTDPWPPLIMLGLGALFTVALISLGRARLVISDGCLRAGGAVLPLASVSEVVPLDERQSARLRGPKGDPAAYLYSRPYLKRHVYLALEDPRVPYWMIGTRHPAELAAAIEMCRACPEPVA